MLFNPLIIYSIMWFGVLGLYSLKIGLIYPNLNEKLYIFLLITSFVSLLLGLYYKKNFKLTQEVYNKDKIKMTKKIFYFICLFFLIEFFLEGKIPILEIIKKTGYTRHDFQGIKSIHYLMIVLTIFYCQRLIIVYFQTSKKIFILYYIILYCIFLALYLRGIVFISIFMTLIIFIINKKITKKKLGILTLILIYFFGIIGNIREGDIWNGNRTFIKSGVIKENDIIDGPWIFSYVYFTNSLANLSLNIESENTKYSFEKFIIKNILPDFIGKRFISESKKEYSLIMESLNTITTYTEAYIYLGFKGMYLLFFIYMFIIIFFSKVILKRTRYKDELLSILFALIFFTFFTNTLVFSVISLQLIFVMIDCFFNRFRSVCYKIK